MRVVGKTEGMRRAALHCHSEYSNTKNLDCIIKLKDLVYESHNMGFSAVALTDHSCLSGHIKALSYGKEINEKNKNFKVILGDEIYLIEDREYKNIVNINGVDKEIPQKYYHYILLAKDEIGHRYLRELSTLAWKNSWWEKRQRRTPVTYQEIKEVIKEKGHLIGSTACLGGYLATTILKYIETNSVEYKKNIIQFLKWNKEIFGEDFYIELQSGTTEEQIKVNNKALQIAKSMEIKCIITDDCHYLHKEDRKLHEAFLNSREADDSVREVGEFYEATYLKDDEDLTDRLNYLPKETIEELCKNTIEIADKCSVYDLHQNTIVPERPIDDYEPIHLFREYYDDYSYIKRFAYSRYTQDLFLLKEIEAGFATKKQEYNETNLARINTELGTLWEVSEKLHQRLSSYYSLVQYLIDLVWEKGNSIVGVSRGSAGGFYIAYLIGICQMNPLLYNLPEWRHLSVDRPELPKQHWANKNR